MNEFHESGIEPGVYAFRDIGRHKASFSIEVRTDQDIFNELKRHLLSRELAFTFDPEKNEGQVYAGMRTVGTFQKEQADE